MDKKGLTILVIAVVVTAGLIGALALTVQTKTAGMACKTTGPTHEIIIKNKTVKPGSVTGSACDKLKITNLDTETREIGFGAHEHHTPYDGVTDRVLRQGQSLTVTM